jgi:hypothetical protein
MHTIIKQYVGCTFVTMNQKLNGEAIYGFYWLAL